MGDNDGETTSERFAHGDRRRLRPDPKVGGVVPAGKSLQRQERVKIHGSLQSGRPTLSLPLGQVIVVTRTNDQQTNVMPPGPRSRYHFEEPVHPLAPFKPPGEDQENRSRVQPQRSPSGRPLEWIRVEETCIDAQGQRIEALCRDPERLLDQSGDLTGAGEDAGGLVEGQMVQPASHQPEVEPRQRIARIVQLPVVHLHERRHAGWPAEQRQDRRPLTGSPAVKNLHAEAREVVLSVPER